MAALLPPGAGGAHRRGPHDLPYVNSGNAIVDVGSEGDLFTHAQAWWPLVIEGLPRPVALLLSVPVWKLMGLM
jgi:hypothetical protein